MSVIEITVQFREDETHVSQTIVLDGIRVRLDTYTNKDDNSWYLDTFDEQGNELVRGIALAVGLDLWFPYRYKDLPLGKLFVQDQSGQPFVDPTLGSFLSGDAALFYTTADQTFEPAPTVPDEEPVAPLP